MRKMLSPQKVRMIVWITLLIGFIIGVVGMFTDITALAVIGVIVMICAIIVHFVLYRCSHCGKFLDRSTGEFCPYCGEKVNDKNSIGK